MDWTTVAIWTFGIVFLIFFFVMWTAGEVVGSVSGVVSTQFMSDRAVRLVVKRIAPSGSRRTPTVVLQFRVFMGASAGRLNAIEAKGMADALDEMVDRKNPKVMAFRGFTLEFIPGQEIGVTTDMGSDTTNMKTARLDYADARALAKLLRKASAS